MDLDFPLRRKDIRDIRVSGIERSTADTGESHGGLRTSLFFPTAIIVLFPSRASLLPSPWPSTASAESRQRERAPMIARKTQRGLVNGVKRRQNVKAENRSPRREEMWACSVAAIPSLPFLVSQSLYFFLFPSPPCLSPLFFLLLSSASGIELHASLFSRTRYSLQLSLSRECV